MLDGTEEELLAALKQQRGALPDYLEPVLYEDSPHQCVALLPPEGLNPLAGTADGLPGLADAAALAPAGQAAPERLGPQGILRDPGFAGAGAGPG